jgi:hypothetical protein
MGEREQDALAEHRRHLVTALHTASQDFDKAVMTLAAGALGVSIAFVNSVAPNPRATFWLGLAWALFGTSLVFILASFITSQQAIRWEIEHLQDDPPQDRPWKSTTRNLNYGAATAFVLGVCSLVVFALLNLGGTNG